MQWFILTPYRSAFWDGAELQLEDNPDPAIYTSEDDVEHYWLTYYTNIFNPARIKREAMLSQMPKKYWKNMPETALIPEMLKNAEHRARRMISESKKCAKRISDQYWVWVSSYVFLICFNLWPTSTIASMAGFILYPIRSVSILRRW